MLIWCLFIFYSINVKTAEPIGAQILCAPNMTLEKVYGCSEFNKWSPKFFDFLKVLKIHEKKMLLDLQKSFVLYCNKESHS